MSDAIFKTAPYNPPHLFVADTLYMLTASIYEFVNSYHKFTARKWNTEDGLRGRQVWWNYWDACIRSEHDDYNRLRYVFWNPVKHGLVETPEDYGFSNYRECLDQGFDLKTSDEVNDVPEF